MVLPWIGFLVFWFKPYTIYQLSEKIYSPDEMQVDTLRVSWNDEVQGSLDSIHASYNGQRYMFPKPPYLEVKVDGVDGKSLLRFKGDYISHLQGDAWSFRLKNKNKKRWKGLKKINFHQPKQRNNINEYVYQKHFESKGHLTLGYDFTVVEKNNHASQLYAYEESLDDSYLVRRNLKGLVLRFDESELFNWMMLEVPDSFPVSVIDKFLLTAEIRVQACNSLIEQELTIEAVYKLNEWRNGRIKTSDIFKVEKTAEFLMLTDLWGSYHSLDYNNVRFFYDQTDRKFELIATDGDSKSAQSLLIENPYLSYQMYFKDAEFVDEYKSFWKKYRGGRQVSSFLLRNINETMMRKQLIENYYPLADNNLAYLVENFELAKNWNPKKSK